MVETLPVHQTVYSPIFLKSGYPSLRAFPFSTWARLASPFWRFLPVHFLEHQDPQGHFLLWLAISEDLHTAFGILVSPDCILVAPGLQQVVDLMTQTLLEPGGKVCIKDPGRIGLESVITVSGAACTLGYHAPDTSAPNWCDLVLGPRS
jgi:GntR family transcriptional regulator / MocR family aminotransferase